VQLFQHLHGTADGLQVLLQQLPISARNCSKWAGSAWPCNCSMWEMHHFMLTPRKRASASSALRLTP
jgi:hypothetical protein